MRRFIVFLRDRRGEGYLGTVLLVLMLCLLLSVVLAETLLMGTIRGAKDKMQADADSYLQSHAVDSFDALKRGTGYGQRLDADAVRAGVLVSLGFGPDGSGVLSFGDGGGIRADVSEPQVDVGLYADAVRVTVTLRVRGYATLFGQVRILPDLQLRIRSVYALRIGNT